MGFAEPGRSPDLLVGSYPTVSPLPRRGTGPRRGGLLSVALSLAFRPVGVTHHRVLWCPDFPPVAGNRSKTLGLRPSPTTSGRLFHPTPNLILSSTFIERKHPNVGAYNANGSVGALRAARGRSPARRPGRSARQDEPTRQPEEPEQPSNATASSATPRAERREKGTL